jgi:hypothetical protein
VTSVVWDQKHRGGAEEINDDEATKLWDAWKEGKQTYDEDATQKKIFAAADANRNAKTEKDWVEWSDSPGWSGGKATLPAKLLKFIALRLSIKVTATGTDGKSKTEGFRVILKGKSKGGEGATWESADEIGPESLPGSKTRV